MHLCTLVSSVRNMESKIQKFLKMGVANASEKYRADQTCLSDEKRMHLIIKNFALNRKLFTLRVKPQ